MVCGHGLAPFLGVNLGRDFCGTHQIAEQHRQMTPLAGRYFMRFRRGVEGRSALIAKPGLRSILESAFGTSVD
jgi:hypothetical protein